MMNSDIREIIILRMFTIQSIYYSEISPCMVAVTCVVNISFTKNVEIRIWAKRRWSWLVCTYLFSLNWIMCWSNRIEKMYQIYQFKDGKRKHAGPMEAQTPWTGLAHHNQLYTWTTNNDALAYIVSLPEEFSTLDSEPLVFMPHPWDYKGEIERAADHPHQPYQGPRHAIAQSKTDNDGNVLAWGFTWPGLAQPSWRIEF